MRFSKNGPDIPAELIDASIRGEVVFLCGAGVSQASGLANFRTLTERIFERLAEKMTPAERLPFDNDRYEETLGALARRVVDQRTIYRAVAAELDAERATDTLPHKTILRLSRDFESRPAVVTTNFDTLFERALFEVTGKPTAAKSFATAQIPAPGGPRFEGIIHLHGRLADAKMGLHESDLVLTSADYGDAYLRSGWASRFLFDLARTKNIVLVGYSASDPPVRYILNILEADRERFPDIKSVYAIDAHGENEAEQVIAAWEAISVEAIPCEVTNQNFKPIWDDLSQWADLAETPRSWRKTRLQQLISRPVAELESWETEQGVWLLGHDDVVQLLPSISTPPDWLGLMRAHNVKISADSEWPIAQWANKHLHDEEAFRQMLGFATKLGPAAAGIIDRGLTEQRETPISQNLQTAWRLLAMTMREPRREDHWHHTIAVDRIKAGNPTYADLEAAVDRYVPRLSVREPHTYELGRGQERLASLCRVELEPERHADIDELLGAVATDTSSSWRLLNVASEGLLRGLGRACDADRADGVTHDVPSIGAHPQNAHHDGFLPITRICAQLWLRVQNAAPEKALTISDLWRHSSYALTTRLWLFTLLHNVNLTPTQVIDGLLSLSRRDFWGLRKEVLELLRDRCAGASDESIFKLTENILLGPELSGDRDDDDKARGLDSTRWLYLKALIVGAAKLPNNAQVEFDAINQRRGWQDRPLEEQDYFWIWSYGVRYGPLGDPAPIAEVEPFKRIEIATALERQDPFNQSDAWRVYCKQDPSGALDAAIAADTGAVQTDRWRDVLWGIQDVGKDSEEAKIRGGALCRKAFLHLERCEDESLGRLKFALVDLYRYAHAIGVEIDDSWWDRLWSLPHSVEIDFSDVDANKDPGYELISIAINRPAGKLIEMIINRLDAKYVDQSERFRLETERRLSKAIEQNDLDGLYAMAEIARHIGRLHAFAPQLLTQTLISRLVADTPHGEALRSILVGMAPHIYRDLRVKLRDPILRGVREHRPNNDTSENVVGRVVAYVRDDLARQPNDPNRLAVGEAKEVLSDCHESLRVGAAEVMGDWLKRENERGTADLWRTEFSKIFETIWPVGKKHQTSGASISLAKLTLAAGDAFPEAWDTVRPYIKPLDQDWPHLYFLSGDESRATLDKFPSLILDMLWALLKPADRGRCHELGKILERISASEPNLKLDRRFQMLETRVLKF